MEKYKEAEDFIKQYYSVVKEKKDLDLIVSESWATAISLYLRLLLHKGLSTAISLLRTTKVMLKELRKSFS